MRIHPLTLALTAAIAQSAFAQTETAGTPIVLDTVTAQAARDGSPLQKLAASVSVTSAETAQKNLQTSTQDVLNDIAGVSFDGVGRYGLSDVTIRGVTGNRVKVLADGQEIADEFNFGPFQRTGRQFTDLNNLKQVEVIKGPASSLHGSDAIGGVVNLVTKDPEDYLQDGKAFGGTVFSTYTGKNGGITSGFTAAGQLNDKFSGLVSYTHSDFHETKNHGGRDIDGVNRTVPNPQDSKSHSISAKLAYQASADSRFTFSASQYHLNTDTEVKSSLGRVPSPPTPLVYNYSDYTGSDTKTRTAVSLRHDFTLNSALADSGYWQLGRQWQKGEEETYLDRQLTAPRPSARTISTRDSQYKVQDTSFETQLNKHIAGSTISQDLVYGLSYSHKNVSHIRYLNDGGRASTERNAPNSAIDKAGIYAQDRISFGDSGFTLIPGARYDYYRLNAKPDSIYAAQAGTSDVTNYNEGRLSLRLGALYALPAGNTLYANYAEGFRAPAFSETNLGFSNQQRRYTYLPNPDLKPETSKGIEFGIKGETDVLSYDAALYYNRYKNFIATQYDTGINPATGFREYVTKNLPSAEIYGIDASASLNIGAMAPAVQGLKVAGSLTYAKGKNRETGAPLNTINPLSGSLTTAYDAPSGTWGAALTGRFAAGKKAKDIDTSETNTNYGTGSASSPLGGYAVWDATGYYQPVKGLTIRGGVFNIFDKKYLTWHEARLIGDSERETYSAPDRWFGASLRYDF